MSATIRYLIVNADDFGYGRGINKHATLIAANLSSHELKKNRRPDIPVEMHAGDFLVALATADLCHRPPVSGW